ncbi:hypothetical protein [Novipirellula artificiosorum]|uniref:hypothetical protein n=1 Tax=Novipirellula artificiosorum TaxID=2528016 RepID=UPI0011B4F3E9|nr:hypothetical protein [Novipirellula artificiosorum]
MTNLARLPWIACFLFVLSVSSLMAQPPVIPGTASVSERSGEPLIEMIVPSKDGIVAWSDVASTIS